MDNLYAVITGASRGIGLAVAEKFAQNGINLALVCNNSIDKMKNACSKWGEKYSICVKCYKADLAKEEQILDLYSSIKKDFPRVDILVNNAGICLDKELKDRTLDDFKATMSVNLYAPFLLSKLFGYDMLDNKYGKIVNISSNNSNKCFYPTTIDYDASKSALNVLTKDFAIALSPYVNVNCVAPGWVNTEMNKDVLPPDVAELEAQKILKKHIASPSEIASLVYFLTQDDFSYINGEVITIDGGMF